MCYTDLMFGKKLSIFILSMILTGLMGTSAFAGTRSGPASSGFPYTISFDADPCGRLCYAGHRGQGVAYHDGYAVTPDTMFEIERSGYTDGVSEEGYALSMDIALIYENEDQTGFHREILRKYDEGDLVEGEEYPLFSENMIESLEDRGKLYSDSLLGYEITLAYHSRDTRKKKFYMYVCSDDDFYEYLDNDDYEFEDVD